jgi:hypothetical protein
MFIKLNPDVFNKNNPNVPKQQYDANVPVSRRRSGSAGVAGCASFAYDSP